MWDLENDIYVNKYTCEYSLTWRKQEKQTIRRWGMQIINTSCERGHTAKCFSSSNSVVGFVLTVDRCKNLMWSVTGSVLNANSNYI